MQMIFSNWACPWCDQYLCPTSTQVSLPLIRGRVQIPEALRGGYMKPVLDQLEAWEIKEKDLAVSDDAATGSDRKLFLVDAADSR